MNATKTYHNGLGDDDYLEVEDGAITISDEIGHMLVSTKITDILLGNPTGKSLKFLDFTIDCTCGESDCETYLNVYDDGGLSVYREDGACYNTKVDPRHTARIYEYWYKKQVDKAKRKAKKAANDKAQAEAELEAERQADAYILAENEHYYNYFQAEILAEFAATEANEVQS
jgi:hypothetical protein